MNHLTTQQIDVLKHKLSERTHALAAQVREALAATEAQHHRDLAGAVADTADEALASALVDVDTAIIDHHLQELRDIEAARRRMEDETYGTCIDCGDSVVYERLAVHPIANRCVRCQEQHERVYDYRGTPTL